MQIQILDDFDLDKIISCGQCFRAKSLDDGWFRFVSRDHVLYIKKEEAGEFSISCTDMEWKEIWTPYFDLNRSYKDIYYEEQEKHDFVRKAMDCGRGIRILRQDPWEMLITFIISQRKNIPAISKSVEALAEKYGHPIETEQEILYSFPTPGEMESASAEELQKCGLGYRIPYICDAIRKVTSGALNLEAIAEYDDDKLFEALQTVHGVGKKVANCICLFGYGRMARVPVDVWISRAVEEDCGGEDPFLLFEKSAGIIQQYIFYYMKNRSDSVK
ncbi:MAG: DNA-3-methyladenine glycosylase 2 family protein [Acetatifactor sp.]|nr:DNA-3-methyladenine glycosylase 2 family protein [Acetatifactor sp.]